VKDFDTFEDIRRQPMKSDDIARWITVVSTVTLALVAILLLFTGNLPTTALIRRIIRYENARIARESEKRIQRSVQESAEKIIQQIVGFRESPEEVRNQVYKDALKQAEEKGYIFKIKPEEQYYLTSHNWREEDRAVLLTENEISIIQAFVKKHSEKDLFSLMDSVLSDDKMNAERERKEAYDVEYYKPNRMLGNNILIEPDEKIETDRDVQYVTKKTILHLTPYDKIGIIGGYIGQIKLESVPD